VSARNEIRAASSEDCAFVPPNLYDVIARRSVRKQSVQMVTTVQTLGTTNSVWKKKKSTKIKQ